MNIDGAILIALNHFVYYNFSMRRKKCRERNVIFKDTHERANWASVWSGLVSILLSIYLWFIFTSLGVTKQKQNKRIEKRVLGESEGKNSVDLLRQFPWDWIDQLKSVLGYNLCVLNDSIGVYAEIKMKRKKME